MSQIKQINGPHFRVGWEHSSDNDEMVRYHGISVDYDEISTKTKMGEFIKELSKIGSIKIIRQPIKGKVKDSNLEYLFQSFDSRINVKEIDFTKIGRAIIRDSKLCEQLLGGIDNYVEQLYSNPFF